MKVLLIVIACTVALIVVVVGGLAWWGINQRIDTSDPNTAKTFNESFKKGFERSCVDGIDKRLVAAGKPPSPEQDAKFTQLCGCMADDTIARADANGGMKISDILLHPEQFAQQMQESSKACAAKLGLQGN